jgi:hypothetical protein
MDVKPEKWMAYMSFYVRCKARGSLTLTLSRGETRRY